MTDFTDMLTPAGERSGHVFLATLARLYGDKAKRELNRHERRAYARLMKTARKRGWVK